MGIFNFIKSGTQQLAIARPDAAKDNWVYKHPDQNIPSHAQLTVDSDEVALFFKDGKVVGTLPPGRHTLDGNNIPFLGLLVDKFTGGNVFISEVFFVSTREYSNIQFGTSVGEVGDPTMNGMRFRLMVHGDFNAKVIDPTTFLLKLVGQRAADNDAFLNFFKGQVQKVMKESIGELIAKSNLSVVDATGPGHMREMESGTLANLRSEVEPYGVEIVRFGDFSVVMDPADKERYDKLRDKTASMGAMASMPGGMATYQQYAQAEMIEGAAEGMKKGGDGGGAAFQGAGIGLGFQMAGQFANMAQQGNAAAQQPHVESKDQIMATLKQLADLKSAGVLTDAEFDAKKKELLAKL
jgi:membrane protease subunit (stomatin/prohibitin family)